MSVKFEKKGKVAIITLDRPEAMNAFNVDMLKAVIDAWVKFRDDDDLWVAILTGSGDKAFSAGADLKSMGREYAKYTPNQRRIRGDREPGLGGITRNLDIWKPIIAAVNGYCLAGGLELALACDIRIASKNAGFGLTEVKWGIIPGAGGTQRLPRAIPVSRAIEMILTAERIDAEEALKLGLINRVVEPSELMPTALEIAERICKNGPLAIRAAKEAILKGMEMPLSDGLRLEQFLAEPLRSSEDAVEGRTAFAEKRKPNFKGK